MRVALLKQLWSEGHSASQIVGRIKGVDLTRNAVIGKVNRLGLPARAPPRQGAGRPRKSRKSAWKPAATLPPEPPRAPDMRQLTLFELGPMQCRWPIGVGACHLFCGADAAKDEVYCPFHQHMARRE